MRSVTFADGDVVALLNEKFVCCWINLDVERSIDLPQFTKEQLAPYAEGGGARSLTSIFALPDGRVVNEARGWSKPKPFLAESSFALGLTAENAAAKRASLVPLSGPLLGPVAGAITAFRNRAVS
jgi:hypothetical protein